MLIFFLFFCLKAYLRCTKPLRMKPGGLHVTSLFWVTISSWVRKAHCVAKAHMSPVLSGGLQP